MAECVGQAPVKEDSAFFLPRYDSAVCEADTVRSAAGRLRLEAPLRYCHLPDADRQQVDAVLRGWRPLDSLPGSTPRVVRVFVSSTCTDMQNERDRLTKDIYPKLKAYCRERYGVELQVVDMTWGEPAHVWKNHNTTHLCLQEIRNCASKSLGPNFILFLGQRYGARTLPASLPMAEYEAIHRALQEADVDVAQLDQWYLKDSNYQPPVYILQPIELILGDDPSPWEAIHHSLDEQLLQGATACVSQGLLKQDVLDRLKASVVALEVMEAFKVLPSTEDLERHFLCFMRTISDLDSKLDREIVSAFCDQLPNRKGMNWSALKEVNQLRQLVKHALPEENLYEGDIQWLDPDGIDPVGHEDYLEELCNDFYKKMRNLIDMNVVLSEVSRKDDMYDDVLHHWEMTHEKCKNFKGREDILNQIQDYLLSITEEPLVLCGDSGHGKTSLMAKAAGSITQWLLEDDRNIQTTTVVRYCGTSPLSSNIRALLPSICHQMAYTTDRFRHMVPKTYKAVKQYFLDFVSQGEFQGLIIIFLDAIDQLSLNDGAHKLDWFPAKIAKNVKIVISTLPGDILTRLKSKITNEERYIQVDPLDIQSCFDIIKCWMKAKGKDLQFRQWQLVREAFSKCSLPLFVQLTFEKVLSWHSYQEAEELSLMHCINDSINEVFDQLEDKYGKIIVIHALAYLTASGGLSDTEMDDILSLDDVALNGVFTFSFPPIRRNPPNIWQRIRHDISSYLVDHEDSEIRVFFWYHRQFIEVATQRYLNDPQMRQHIHGTIADYFLGTWSGQKRKVFAYDMRLKDSMEVVTMEGEAVRYVPEQPLVFSTFCTMKRYNIRKLNHLPCQLAMAGRVAELKSEVYFNYEWLSNKLMSCSVQNVIVDYDLINDKETMIVGDALRMSESALSIDVKVLGLELTGRLLPHVPKYPHIRWLNRQCDIAAVSTCGVVPNWQIYTCPGGPLQYACEAEGSITSSLNVTTIESTDRLLLTAKPASSTKMRVWDITQGEPRLDLHLPPQSAIHPTRDGQFITLFTKNASLQVFRVENGEMHADIPYGNGVMQQVSVGNKYAAFTLKQAIGPCVVDIEAGLLIHRFQYQSDTVLLSADDHYLLCNSNQQIAFHELPIMERKCLIEVSDLPLKLAFHGNDPKRFFALFKNNDLCAYKMDLNHKSTKSQGLLHDHDLKDFKLGHTNTLLLARALRCLFVFSIDDTCQYKLKYRVIQMPAGVFHEKLSTFKEAGFTPDDELLIAGRHTYLGIWRASDGKPLRLLQTTVSPIVNLFTSSISSNVITVLQDNTIQVWNLDNLNEDISHCNLIVKGAVRSLAIASQGHQVVACGSQFAEARILDLTTGKNEKNLVHNDEAGQTIRKVCMSPRGHFALTQMDNMDVEEDQQPWDLLTEDKLWNTSTGNQVFQLTRCRSVIFSNDDEKVVFFRCCYYSLHDFSMNAYEAIVFHTITGIVERVLLPAGELCGDPVILDQGQYLAALMQCYDEAPGGKRFGHIRLFVHSFEGSWHEMKELSLSELWSGVEPDDAFLNIRVLNGENLLVIYMHGVTCLPHTSSGALDFMIPVRKAALMYNLRHSMLIRRLDQFLGDDSNVLLLQPSRNLSIIMDNHFRFYDVILNELLHKLTLPQAVTNRSATLFMDGQYIAVISENHREILIYRCKDGVRKSRLFVHGEALQIAVGVNDRTIVVGCSDGRAMLFTALFEHPDPVGELIGCLPSRTVTAKPTIGTVGNQSGLSGNCMALTADIKHINISQAQLEQLSVTKKAKHEAHLCRPSSHKIVRTGVVLAQRHHRQASSRACTVQ